ncbi:MAG: hypothetical protein IJQ82_03895 [Selenomonadaceae bacterium]|nr:hypothetical protein [Selenomonadaceae bacterium]
MSNDFPEAIEMEKQLLSAMFLHNGRIVPKVISILEPDNLFRVEHRLIFQAILRLYSKGVPIDYLAVEEELRKSGHFKKIDHSYLLSLIDAAYSTARAEYHANIIKEKANLRRLIKLSEILIDEAKRNEKSFNEILAFAENHFSNLCRDSLPSKALQINSYFANHLKVEID